MTVRRINYTGRKRFERKRISIEMDWPAFSAALDPNDCGLPETARVFIEAYRQTARFRFPFGTVANICPPGNTDLSGLETPEGVLFRVMAVDTDGKILARTDRIRPDNENPATRDSLLPVRPSDQLGEQIYRLDLGGDEPILEVNSSFDDWLALVQSAQFSTLAFPALIREILTYILAIERYRDAGDMDDWKSQWLLFAQRQLGAGPLPPPPEDDGDDDAQALLDWIEQAVAGFCEKHHAASGYLLHWREEEQ